MFNVVFRIYANDPKRCFLFSNDVRTAEADDKNGKVLTDISSFRIVVKLFHVQIAGVDVVKFVGLLIPGQAVRDSDLIFQWNELFLAGVAIERSKPLLENVDV